MTETGPPPAQALVIVPFPTMDEARVWAAKVADDYPGEPPLLVTQGSETVVLDQTGETHHELCFEDGWRAKVADSHAGVVVITRTTDAGSASLFARKPRDAEGRHDGRPG